MLLLQCAHACTHTDFLLRPLVPQMGYFINAVQEILEEQFIEIYGIPLPSHSQNKYIKTTLKLKT